MTVRTMCHDAPTFTYTDQLRFPPTISVPLLKRLLSKSSILPNKIQMARGFAGQGADLVIMALRIEKLEALDRDAGRHLEREGWKSSRTQRSTPYMVL